MKFVKLLIITFLSSIIISFYYTIAVNQRQNDKAELFIQKYLKSIEETFDLYSLKITGIAELHYSEKDEHFLSSITNPLFSKEYHFYIPFEAVYGISLKNVHFIKFYGQKIYVTLPAPELMMFDLQLQNKKIYTKEGWLVLQKDEKFINFEKKIYEKQKSELINDKELKKKAQKEAQKQITELLKPLNLPIEFSQNFFQKN